MAILPQVARLLSREPDMNSQPIYYDQLLIVVGAHSKWAKLRRVGLADLAEEAWVQAAPEMEPGSPTLEAFRAVGLAGPRVVVMSASLNLRYALLATGRFVTMIPDPVLYYGPQLRPGHILPIELPKWHVPTSVVTLKDRTLSPIAQLFIDCLHELARPLVKAPGVVRDGR